MRNILPLFIRKVCFTSRMVFDLLSYLHGHPSSLAVRIHQAGRTISQNLRQIRSSRKIARPARSQLEYGQLRAKESRIPVFVIRCDEGA